MPSYCNIVVQIPGHYLYPITIGLPIAFSEIVNISGIKIYNPEYIVEPPLLLYEKTPELPFWQFHDHW